MKSLPYWSLDSIFPGLDSTEFTQAKNKLEKDIAKLETFFDKNDIRAGNKLSVSKKTLETLDTLLDTSNKLSLEFSSVGTFLMLITSTDAFNEKAQAERSKLSSLAIRSSNLSTRFTAWVGRHDAKKLIRSDKAKAHRYSLEKSVFLANRLMGQEAEELYSSLRPSSSVAWSKLHDSLTSRATIKRKVKGTAREYTIAELKSLSNDKDVRVRKAAFEAEHELLTQHQDSFAAAMNSIKGQVNEVAKKRGWESGLAQALFINSISSKSLEAMQQACQESFPVFSVT
jgi:oligoendopeptidase F